MTNFASRIAGAATLALAVLPLAAIATASQAAPARVVIGDLNLTTEEGLTTFNRRARLAATDYCSGIHGLTARASCRSGVRVELQEKMVTIRQARLADQTKTLAAR
ncbi:UrcA family protein [Phenylobacterium sp.]|uniref:UrcA family protein n=1 Tax=Phenylobacterium sp. TaxID=1871053 RepID=UPI00398313CA